MGHELVPVALAKVPAKHALQTDRPVTEAYVATAQAEHAVRVVPAPNEPVGHGEQTMLAAEVHAAAI